MKENLTKEIVFLIVKAAIIVCQSVFYTFQFPHYDIISV